MAKHTNTKVRLYRSYSFIDKDPVIDKLRTLYQKEKLDYWSIAALSGISVATMQNWFEGDTRTPRHATVMAFAGALGYRQEFVQARKPDYEKELAKLERMPDNLVPIRRRKAA